MALLTLLVGAAAGYYLGCKYPYPSAKAAIIAKAKEVAENL